MLKCALNSLFVIVCSFPNWSAALQGPVTTYCNISAGKFYTFSKTANPTYPDVYPNKWTDGSRLTDETLGSSDTSTCVGWHDAAAYNVEISVDLGKVYTIDTAKMQFQSNTGWGIYFPDSLEIFVRSSTSDTWIPYGTALTFPVDTPTYSYYWAQGNGGIVQCRYVKYRVNVSGLRHLFISELEVWGNVINTFRGAPDWGCYHGCYASDSVYGWDIPYFETTTTADTNKPARTSMVLWYHFMNPTEYPAESDFTYMGRWWNKSKGLGTSIFGYRYLEIGWLPYNTTAATIASGGVDGVYDDYFETWFTKSIDPSARNGTNNTDPIWIRPMNEFNGSWTFPESTGNLKYGGNPTTFKAAWRRMYNIAEQVGAAQKHIFVWSPQAVSMPADSWNKPDKYYPGDQYVDWIGLSLYSGNMGGLCTNVYPIYQLNGTGGTGCFDFLSHWTYKPMMIAEGGWCWSDGSDGTQWINGWFDIMHSVPRLKAAVWFETKVPENGNYLFDISKWPQDKLNLFKSRLTDSFALKRSRAGRLDYNGDYAVNFKDFNRIAKDWWKNGNLQPDINGDDYVKWADICIFVENWLN